MQLSHFGNHNSTSSLCSPLVRHEWCHPKSVDAPTPLPTPAWVWEYCHWKKMDKRGGEEFWLFPWLTICCLLWRGWTEQSVFPVLFHWFLQFIMFNVYGLINSHPLPLCDFQLISHPAQLTRGSGRASLRWRYMDKGPEANTTIRSIDNCDECAAVQSMAAVQKIKTSNVCGDALSLTKYTVFNSILVWGRDSGAW